MQRECELYTSCILGTLHLRVDSYLNTSRDVLGPSRNTENNLRHPVQGAHLTRFGWFSDLQSSGANYPGLVVLSGYGYYSRNRVAETTSRGAQRTDGRRATAVREVRQQSANAATNAALTGLTSRALHEVYFVEVQGLPRNGWRWHEVSESMRPGASG